MVPNLELKYDDDTLALLATNLKDQDVLLIFQNIMKFRDRGGFIKAHLPEWGTKRRRYDNAFLILEATKFIHRDENGSSTPYYPTNRGMQLALYLINELHHHENDFRKLSDEEYENFLRTRELPNLSKEE